MAEMRGGARARCRHRGGDVAGAGAALERDVEHVEVVLRRRDGQDVVALGVERVGIGAEADERARRGMVLAEYGDVQRRAAVGILDVRPLAGGDQPLDLGDVASGGGGVQAGIDRAGRARSAASAPRPVVRAPERDGDHRQQHAIKAPRRRDHPVPGRFESLRRAAIARACGGRRGRSAAARNDNGRDEPGHDQRIADLGALAGEAVGGDHAHGAGLGAWAGCGRAGSWRRSRAKPARLQAGRSGRMSRRSPLTTGGGVRASTSGLKPGKASIMAAPKAAAAIAERAL